MPPVDGTDTAIEASQGAAASTQTDTAASPAVDTSSTTAADTSSTGGADTTTTTGAEPTDLLSAVRAVLKPDTAEPSPAEGSGADEPASKSGSDKPDPNAATAETDPNRELTEADFADVEKPSVKKRIDTLLAQRAAARTEAETLRDPAGHWQKHVQFLVENQVSPENSQAVYGILSLIHRGDWANAAAAIRPWYELVLRQAGDILPEDIQRRVDVGDLSPGDAGELSRARAAAASAEHQRLASEQQHTVADTSRQLDGTRQAVAQWETGIAQRDPDFALKRVAVMRYAQAIVAERGLPPTPATAVQWANEALGEVNKLFTAARPQPQPTRPIPSSGTSQTRARPEPRNLLEAAKYALADMRA